MTAQVRINTTLDTVSDYLSDARILLQDIIEPFRYDDASLLTALNVALLEGRRLRADLFVFNDRDGGIVPHYSVNDNSVVPIEQQFRLAFLHGVVGHAIERDQEDLQDERAVWFLNVMANILTGKNLVTPKQPGE
jgi:hypothetical protein